MKLGGLFRNTKSFWIFVGLLAALIVACMGCTLTLEGLQTQQGQGQGLTRPPSTGSTVTSPVYNPMLPADLQSAAGSSTSPPPPYPTGTSGIPKSQIPPGQEDLYVLKSSIAGLQQQAACGAASAESKCPPCPACARCPEPAFDCKKVPNYRALNNDYLPTPVLNDFSTFGM